jgi:hypothetical protein
MIARDRLGKFDICSHGLKSMKFQRRTHFLRRMSIFKQRIIVITCDNNIQVSYLIHKKVYLFMSMTMACRQYSSKLLCSETRTKLTMKQRLANVSMMNIVSYIQTNDDFVIYCKRIL